MDTETLYDANAGKWERRAPSSLSDFTGRPAVFELCGDVVGLDVLDLGAGEGYCSRILASHGAKSVTGVELSAEMVAAARRQDERLGQGITYHQGDATELGQLATGSFDLVAAVFLYNYLTVEQMTRSFAEVRRLLRAGGAFVFAVPHPALGFIRREHRPPFYFDVEGCGYFSGANRQFQGEISRRDGGVLPVQMIHKTFGDYFSALASSGFTALPEIRELGVLPEHLALDHDFFAPVRDLPLHLAVRAELPGNAPRSKRPAL
ncbi:MAG: SAM-dependent methyltransferase [Xanthomonadales bacterium]|mgnify:CR=1 FL=1|jgi:SAM-dependent methyltransferase|nr:SAM-dependent methyltransferase [Xanthomonadales bacterium]MBB87886.1 SAM-dependent methyltransferase [Xanthomonadales bacterium]